MLHSQERLLSLNTDSLERQKQCHRQPPDWSHAPGVCTPHWPVFPEWPSLRIKKWELGGRINGKQTPTNHLRNGLRGIFPSKFICLPWGGLVIRNFQSTYDCLPGSFLSGSIVSTAHKWVFILMEMLLWHHILNANTACFKWKRRVTTVLSSLLHSVF